MNVVKILLVLGLGYVALTHKSEKTRNMLLVVTGLLAFCMFSVEGFDSITFTAGADGGDVGAAQTAANTSGAGELTVGGQITSSGEDGRVYTFPVGFNVAEGTPIPTYTCGDGKVPVTAPTAVDGELTADTVETAYPCNDTGPSNGEQRVSGPEADPCNCLTAVDGRNLYCNSGWMNSEILEYMDSDGKKTDKYEDAHKCWSGTLDFIPKLGDSFVGRCTKKAGSGPCTAPAATGGD